MQPATLDLQPETFNVQPETLSMLRSSPVPQRPPVTIIILTWNGLEYTRRCIESIRAHTKDVAYHLLVVDNGSSDGTLEWLRQQADIRVIANDSNLGFARGNNQGMAATPPDHDVVLLNNDTLIVQDHWLAHLSDVANSHPEYGIVGCTLLHANGLLQHAGTYMPADSFWGYQIGGGETYIGQYPGVREVEGITGACMYIRRDVRARIGGFDEAYTSYFEDTDYCLRARQAGFKVVCTGGTQVVHYENTSVRINNASWRAMWDAGRETFIRKWRTFYNQKYRRAIVWHSLVASPSGYATSSRELVIELDRCGIDVRLACIWGNDFTEPLTGDPRIDQLRARLKDTRLPQVVYHQGDSFIKNSGRYRIGYTMLETDRLPDEWVYQANQMDEVWTPTHWGAEVFRASGVRRPVYVVPLGVNPNYFHPGIAGRKPGNRFVFLSIFEWIERKAPELLIRAYQQTFRRSDDVLLLLKILNHDPSLDIARRISDLIRSDGPPIVVLPNQKVASYQVGCLYRSADCFVLPTRGEGWGMTTLEAMACGLPVISTDWGGQTEFLHSGIAYPLRIRGLVPAEARTPYYRGLRWADPDFDHLCTLMRHVYEHPEEARAVGARAAVEVAARWTWSHAAAKIIERLEAIE
ncbi:MAG: glycosyltransferase [Roseiflexus sp.]|nr:glycosyltransferase [Roseiflexus sp.]